MCTSLFGALGFQLATTRRCRCFVQQQQERLIDYFDELEASRAIFDGAEGLDRTDML